MYEPPLDATTGLVLIDSSKSRYNSAMAVSNSSESLRTKTRKSLDRLRAELLSERTSDGHWVGQLSPSSLSTATAISAIAATLLAAESDPDAARLDELVGRGMEYLRGQQNADGGYGDTDRSHSNIATSYLVLAASSLADQCIGCSLDRSQQERLQAYIRANDEISGLRRRYGKDKTFVVPILTNLAIAGLVDWDQVAALPFEAAMFPQSMYRFLGMPVVSYAIPALVAIGQARHFHGRRAALPLRMIRSASIKRTMKVLRRMQPESGGYLEATPLTSFVVMSLAATKRGDCDVSRHGLRFLTDSMTDEGSWPIDTNLATWVTSLAIHALACDPDDDGAWYSESLTDWHLGCQHLRRHPYTGAEAGGWGWSDLSGAVPDSDDTPAAILALHPLGRWADDESKRRIDEAVARGKGWLLKLQNRDGGWPTFCRGWGKLPFDRSSTDLTGHAIRALCSVPGWRDVPGCSGSQLSAEVAKSSRQARSFLEKQQREDGSWVPLWFGNQDLDDETNPVYGTARVLVAAQRVGLSAAAQRRGCEFLLANQNLDGGWGGGCSVTAWLDSQGIETSLPASTDPNGDPTRKVRVVSSIEETALALDALATVLLTQRNLSGRSGVEIDGQAPPKMELPESQMTDFGKSLTDAGKNGPQAAIIRAIEFLLRSVDDGRHRVPWPIGFYFAKLWYHERLYPLIFTVTALGKYLRATADDYDPDWPR